MLKKQHMLNFSLQMYIKLQITYLILSLTGKLMNFINSYLSFKVIDDHAYLWTIIILWRKRYV